MLHLGHDNGGKFHEQLTLPPTCAIEGAAFAFFTNIVYKPGEERFFHHEECVIVMPGRIELCDD